MLSPSGYATIVEPDRRPVERDTITCGHCQRVVFVKPGTASTVYLLPRFQAPDVEEPGAMCRVCMRAICIPCCDLGRCTPFERRIERAEARARFLATVGVAS